MLVLNPRLPEQSAEWTQAIKSKGAEVVELPLIALRLRELTDLEKSYLLMLDRYDGCVFVSQNAAKIGLNAVADYWPQWPYQLPVFAVGQSSVQPLLDAALVASIPEQANSEGLLAMPAMQAEQVAGKRILLFRGTQGRDLLVDTLRQRGATVDIIELYDLVLPKSSIDTWRKLPIKPSVVLLTSPVIWKHWQIVAGADALAPTLIASSQRLVDNIKAVGAKNVRVVEGASLAHWLAAIPF